MTETSFQEFTRKASLSMATNSQLSPTERGGSEAMTPATSLNPSPNVPGDELEVSCGHTTDAVTDTDVTIPLNVNAGTEEATTTSHHELPKTEEEPEPGDKSADTEGLAQTEDEADSESTSSSDMESSIISTDSSTSGLAQATRRVSHTRRRGKMKTKLMQHWRHLVLTDDRIRLLESRLDKFENKPPRPPASLPPRPPMSPSPTPKDSEVAAIPELNFVDWATFKATRTVWHVNVPPRHVIDVLLGEPLLYPQRHGSSNDIEEPPRLPSNEAENMPLKAMPERIRINSVPLLETLKSILGMPNRSSMQPLVMLRPYKALLYHEQDFRNTLAALEKRIAVRSDVAIEEPFLKSRDHTTKIPVLTLKRMREAPDELLCLLRFIESLKALIDELKQTNCLESPIEPQSAMILFTDLWHIFRPGQYIFSRSGIQKVWRVIQTTGGRRLLSLEVMPSKIDTLRAKPSSPFRIDCYYLDFDGSRFGPVHRRFQIRPFEGLRQITALDLHPLEYQGNHKDLIDKLTKRGAEFVGLTQVSHKYFKGRTIVEGPDGARITGPMQQNKNYGISYQEHVESPVIVDFNRTIQLNPEWGPKLSIGELAEPDVCEVIEMSTAGDNHRVPTHPGDREPPLLDRMCRTPVCCQNEDILLDFLWDRRVTEEFVSKEEILSPYGVDKDYVVSEEQLRLLPNRVFGFILRSRKWGESLSLNEASTLLVLDDSN